eukprot:11427981-Alexandrium_andersonii.AAC.1
MEAQKEQLSGQFRAIRRPEHVMMTMLTIMMITMMMVSVVMVTVRGGNGNDRGGADGEDSAAAHGDD